MTYNSFDGSTYFFALSKKSGIFFSFFRNLIFDTRMWISDLYVTVSLICV